MILGAVTVAAAVVAQAHGALDERIAQLKAKIALQPADAALRFELADVQIMHEEWPAALAELAQVDRLAPGQYPTDLLRGAALLALGETAGAKAVLDTILATDPGQGHALRLRARAWAALGGSAESLADYRAALRATARPDAELIREAAEAFATSGHTDEAVTLLADGIERLGPVPALMLQALELETATARFDAALARIDVLQKSAALPETWMARRATVLAQAGRADEARAAWAALLSHIGSLPSLRRGAAPLRALAEQAQRALADPPSLSGPSLTSTPASSS